MRLTLTLQDKAGERVMHGAVLQYAEGPFLLEAVDAATHLLRYGITLHKRKTLRYCPGRIFLRIVSRISGRR